MPERLHARGLVDTSVVISLEGIDAAALRSELVMSAVTLAELAAGPMRPTIPATGRDGRTGSSERRRVFDPFPLRRSGCSSVRARLCPSSLPAIARREAAGRSTS